MFRIGQKVICVETWDSEGRGRGDEVGPVAGIIYTVREIGHGLHPEYATELQVRLIEITNPKLRYYWGRFGAFETSFRASRFRPVVERKTDISIFQAMLTPSPVTVDAMNVADHVREIVR